jgi:hypothetical protein
VTAKSNASLTSGACLGSGSKVHYRSA